MVKNRETQITDHALLRYLERMLGFDIEALKRELLTDEVRRAIKAGARRVHIKGVTFVVSENRIVTIYETKKRA